MNRSKSPCTLVYQIFPDRFFIGKQQTADSKFERKLYPAHAKKMQWDESPIKNDAKNQHFGGDLWGISEKADYIASLGVDAVYITPVYEAPSYHRYDSVNYRSVDKALGGMDAFRTMIGSLHQKGIKVIIDLVLNHLSSNHPFFIEAKTGSQSPFRDYFLFNDDGSYACWWGNSGMPELNLENNNVVEEFITGPNSVLKFWIDMDIDGFRLDCANDLGIKICSIVSETAKKIKPDIYIIGETFHYGAQWKKGLDGIQSYYYTASILSLLHGEISSRQFGMNISTLFNEMEPLGGIHQSWCMLSSHDFPRPLTTLHGDIAKFKLAVLLQFTLPGIPMIYYGDEIGMQGGEDPGNRAPMIWDEKHQSSEIRKYYRQIIALRKSRNEFAGGNFVDFSDWLSNGVAGFMRTSKEDPRDYCLIFVNPSKEPRRFTLFVPAAHMFSDLVLKDYFTGSAIRSSCGSITIEIPAVSGAVYIPDYHCKEHYLFSKRL